MPVNTLSVGVAVTPTVIQTYFLHYLRRQPLQQKPTAHISYHEGLELIRRFLYYASFHTVDELQAFTSQWVPVPHWVYAKDVEIPATHLSNAAKCITAQLGPAGIRAVGGSTWWQWRRDGTALKAEWIEMRKDYDARKQLNITKGDRIMLYIHGGAYFFGSVDEHRYQLQRHARKLKARVLAPRYRLAPQFPFPCGLLDSLAVYLFLLAEDHDPSTIVLAGDSAGGGMVLSLLVILRDQGIPLPAGAILISPWVDLTHSFPSLGGDGKMDYIPAHGFVHKPSLSWPPPNADDLLEIESNAAVSSSSPEARHASDLKEQSDETKAERVHGFSVRSTSQQDLPLQSWTSADGKYSVGPKGVLSVQLEDVRVEIKDQIQMYAPNHLLTHPLVSPVLQPSLGGLPPLLIQCGGGEILKDEQIYLAHKAAQPLAYMPPPSNNQSAEAIQELVAKYRPTNVQLQVWDDLCHVCPTLSFTRPAKYMYRSIAQFGAWALARAQQKSIDILDDDQISFVSSGSSSSFDAQEPHPAVVSTEPVASKAKSAVSSNEAKIDNDGGREATVGKAGDALPPFERHMIRQRIDRHGRIYPLAPKEELIALNIPKAEVGVPKSGPVTKWMKASQQWNSKFAKQKVKIQRQRIKDMRKGYEGFDGEQPPPTALAGRRLKGMKAEAPKKKSWGMAMWSGWGSKHDEATIVREEKADLIPDQEISKTTSNPGAAATDSGRESRTYEDKLGLAASAAASRPRSRSRHAAVTDEGQTNTPEDASQITFAIENGSAPCSKTAQTNHVDDANTNPPGIVESDNPQSPVTIIPPTDGLSTRPTKGGIAYPFSLRIGGPNGSEVNASTVTLESLDVATPVATDASAAEKQLATSEYTGTGAMESGDKQRPSDERLFTAAPGACLFSSGVEKDAVGDAEKLQRPPIERFETAQESLGTHTSVES